VPPSIGQSMGATGGRRSGFVAENERPSLRRDRGLIAMDRRAGVDGCGLARRDGNALSSDPGSLKMRGTHRMRTNRRFDQVGGAHTARRLWKQSFTVSQPSRKAGWTAGRGRAVVSPRW